MFISLILWQKMSQQITASQITDVHMFDQMIIQRVISLVEDWKGLKHDKNHTSFTNLPLYAYRSISHKKNNPKYQPFK